MSKKKDIYKECCIEIDHITRLAPGWSLNDFIKEEDLDITRGLPFYNMLKRYREQLELVSNIIADDEETQKILDEGIKIHGLIMKEQLYGTED